MENIVAIIGNFLRPVKAHGSLMDKCLPRLPGPIHNHATG